MVHGYYVKTKYSGNNGRIIEISGTNKFLTDIAFIEEGMYIVHGVGILCQSR
jgi:hypothetical protein